LTLILVHPSLQTDLKGLARTLQTRLNTPAHIQDGIVVLRTKRIQEITRIFGIAKVSVVIECHSQFQAISKAIIEVGRRTILQGQNFFVKVNVLEHHDFEARDLEFAAMGAIAAELAGISNPAKSEHEANTATIAAYVGKRAFVSLREYEGAGGRISGALGNASCAITHQMSLASCIAACKAGFFLSELLLLYVDEEDLRTNAKLARALAEKAGLNSQKLALVRVTKVREEKTRILQLDYAAARVLAMVKSRNTILPLSLAIHPHWFIELAMKEIYHAGKIPFVPLMFAELEDKNQEGAKSVSREAFMKVRLVPTTTTKHIVLKIGPNYLHDIIDSI
jgi:tRNA(Ser,Leu) C12 N-acetylase TAN1